MEQMWYVLLGAGIFMVGGFFGMLIMALAVAASRDMPKPDKTKNVCGCGNPFKEGVIHSSDGPCWVDPGDPPPAKI